MIGSTVRGALTGLGSAGRIGALLAEIGNGGLSERLHPDPARDAAVQAMLPHVGMHGWSVAAARRGAGPDADLLFPGGPAEMVEAHNDLLDRLLLEAGETLSETRLSRRVRALVLLRLDLTSADREAVRRGMALLALPGHRIAAARMLARTVDTIWRAAGDTATDWSRHSKRAILAGLYLATLLFWLRHGDPAETASFLDRRLAGVARIGKLRARLSGAARLSQR
ncbi:COQ9 family protein [Acetobacteraceae bacterium KSS8]|uniref:COQ9 family protein n=1 Tax=Endosaccharibacter trunci TaxID=2812733 RepID=A0ABT1WBA7_9PROT|nr:COQ9 family protein [Acetobacteraceae bacterium KSS8]